MTTVAIISDTHLPSQQRNSLARLPEVCMTKLREADLIIHGGDLTTVSVLEHLESIGPPVYAVAGNCDEPEVHDRCPETAVISVDGFNFGLIHDAGPAPGRLDRLRDQFPNADAVVFGHSHQPLLEGRNGFRIFNPGSACVAYRAPVFTMGIARVEDGHATFEVISAMKADQPPIIKEA